MPANNHEFRLFFCELVTKIVLYKKFSRATENVSLASTKLHQDFIEVFFVEQLDQAWFVWFCIRNDELNGCDELVDRSRVYGVACKL